MPASPRSGYLRSQKCCVASEFVAELVSVWIIVHAALDTVGATASLWSGVPMCFNSRPAYVAGASRFPVLIAPVSISGFAASAPRDILLIGLHAVPLDVPMMEKSDPVMAFHEKAYANRSARGNKKAGFIVLEGIVPGEL